MGHDAISFKLPSGNQVALVEKWNRLVRFQRCQFIVAACSSFVLGMLQGQIYDLDSMEGKEKEWTELRNVRYFGGFLRGDGGV